MSKGAKQAAQNGPFPALDYERMMTLSSANLEALMQASEAVLTGLARLHEELVGFTSAQIKEQLEAGRTLAECGNWSDALEKQAELMRNASARYFAEVRKLSSLASELAVASWTPLQNCLSAHLSESEREVRKS
ncbi:MAG TPA: phasin family protein [Alphaproteobacteria bacterium]|nr:phasin family protein [Alphaproteobacteria bacterium]